MEEKVLELKGISKYFSGVCALDNVSLNVYKGKAMAVIGENGAGKSTLMKIITGIYKKDAGEIFLFGKKVEFTNVIESQKMGIGMVHQELNLVSDLRVYENVFLGREIKGMFGTIDKKQMIALTKKILKEFDFRLDSNAKIKDLSVAQQQLVEIVKCLYMRSDIIIMDEPSGSLTNKEVQKLFVILEELKHKGKSIIYISHRLEELFEIADDISVYRDGKFIGEKKIKEVDKSELVKMMVGRSLGEQLPYEPFTKGDVALKLSHVSNAHVKDISFELKKGEVLGFGGLIGSGRTELAKTIFGYFDHEGDIELYGKILKKHSVKDALKNGITYVSEDRKGDGLIVSQKLSHNMVLSMLSVIKRHLSSKEEKNKVNFYMDKLKIKASSISAFIKNLSGGNQQKVSIAKSLLTKPKVLILDEPTKGVDVGAKREIYLLINQLKKEDIAIILISSEMPELMGLSDNILVMHDGRLMGEMDRNNFDAEQIMQYALQN